MIQVVSKGHILGIEDVVLGRTGLYLSSAVVSS